MQKVGSFCYSSFRYFLSPQDLMRDKLIRSLPLPLMNPGCLWVFLVQSARAPLAEATCESRMEGAHGLTTAFGIQAEAVV